jgi:hypothetical protein
LTIENDPVRCWSPILEAGSGFCFDAFYRRR